MRRYFAHMKTKTPHERRRHAAGVAGALTTMITIGWLMSLGYTTPTTTTIAQDKPSDISQLAGVFSLFSNPKEPSLEVSTTSVYSN